MTNTTATTTQRVAPAPLASMPNDERPLPYGALSDEISWRSKVFDRIGRTFFGTPEKLGVSPGFYYIAAERPQSKPDFGEMVRDNVRDQFTRRELRALIARRMLIVGAIVVAVSWTFTGSYAQALASSATHFFD
ncbi:hypothetical protein [Burkholderia gladioli]|uniref:hypothetical protein n=1 Tax=Burkholderia gladioli TaxID=28095 RepID=UPI001641256B|nr:hypothetical protein [Burkholderia gladioli]